MALAQQLAALNTTLCGGGADSALFGTPVLKQLHAGSVTMDPLFKLAAALHLERSELMRVAQAGSLIFGAGQEELAARLAAAENLQAGRTAYLDLAACADRQIHAASGLLVLLQQHDDQTAAALAGLGAPNRQLLVWLGSVSDAMRLAANSLNPSYG